MKNFPLTDEQVLEFVSGNEAVLADHYDDLYEFYTSNGEMPYGVAKARTGDPDQWIAEQLEERAKTIRFYTANGPLPTLGDPIIWGQPGISRGETITAHDLDDGTGVGLLPSIDKITDETYRGFRIHFEYPPIPDRRFDYIAVDDNADGLVVANGRTIEDCRADVDRYLEEQE